jgi:hypothetical protein
MTFKGTRRGKNLALNRKADMTNRKQTIRQSTYAKNHVGTSNAVFFYGEGSSRGRGAIQGILRSAIQVAFESMGKN